MEDHNNNNFLGDLTDIIRASRASPPDKWQFPTSNQMEIHHNEPGRDDFGDPFTHFEDPLLHESETRAMPGFFPDKLGFSDDSISTLGFASSVVTVAVDVAGRNNNNNIIISNNNNNENKIISDVNIGEGISLEEEMKRPNCYFSRMIQISPAGTLPCESPAAGLDCRNSVASKNAAHMQISSPRNTGIKRRKSQVKKVVCVPAPTPVNSRPSGEIVPSDLWAWRKYGQKPIKGSPYPRGYYRCSSSKGCSARKQVERSRTDPNMLVITYNSEHNHPWPTQRNALAGSTRSQPSKVDTTTGPQSPPPQKSTNEQKETINPKNTSSTTSAVDIIIQSAKEETGSDPDLDPGFEDGFSGSYKPIFPSHDHSEDSFFADLGEIETDSLDMFGFSGSNGPGHTGLDPFIFYDWDGSNDACVGSPGGAATRDANKDLC